MSQCCGDGVRLIYSCSGAADVGELSDHVARDLIKKNFGSKSCLAAVGAGFEGYVQSAHGADENIVIDGCQMACGGKIFENAGIAYTSIILSDMGCTKGKTDVTDELVHEISDRIREMVRTKTVNPVRSSSAGSCCCGN